MKKVQLILLVSFLVLLPISGLAQGNETYGQIFMRSFGEYAGYIWNEITFNVPWYSELFLVD